ncbi:MAG: PD-(D/E)XK nuclease family protein [Methanophagales archaeon]|nr:PD-(D/E)XK nuclease family protein [Methanophagales archaeon]
MNPLEFKYLRKSTINTYLQCPMKLLLHAAFPNISPSNVMKRGTEFHNQAHKFFDKFKEGKKYTYNSFRKLMPPGEMYDNFIEWEWDRYDEGRNKYFMPVLRERWIISRRLRLKGTVDRVEQLDENHFCVVEYKTGKVHSLSMYRRELCIYMLILNDIKILKGPVTHLKCLWVDQKKFLFEKIHPASVKATKRAIEQVRKGIDARKFPKKPSMLCAWCPFIGVCTDLNEETIMNVLEVTK